MRKAAALAVLGGVIGLLSQSCGSSDNKKRVPVPGSGGEGGESATPAGGETLGGAAGTPNDPTPSGGVAGESSVGGAGGAVTDCPTGFAECDGDMAEACEQDLNDLGSCGDCDTTCTNEHGEITCEELACKVLSCGEGYGDCNGNPNDGCETLLTNNGAHCGSCGRDCTSEGAACAVDSCGDIAMQNILVPPGGPFNANAWAFSAEHGVVHMTRTNSLVQRFDLDGKTNATIWDAGAGSSGNDTLVIEGEDVLWAQYGTPSVVRKKSVKDAPSKSPTDLFFPERMPVYLRAQGDYYYWISGDYGEPGFVYRRLRSAAQNVKGTQIVSVAQGSYANISGFAVTTDAIYWITGDDLNGQTIDNDIRTTPLEGGKPTSIPFIAGAADGTVKDFTLATMSTHLTAVGDALYFARTSGDSPLNGVYRYRQVDTAPLKLVEAENITTFSVGKEHVYYALLLSNGIFRAPIAGGQGQKLSDDYVTILPGTDDKFVYAVFINSPSRLYKHFQ